MYTAPGSGRTMIKVGGSDKSKVEPLYCVPIQTTATLNIQLIGQPQRITTTSISTSNQSTQSDKVTSFRTSTAAAGTSAMTPTKYNIGTEIPVRKSTTFGDDASSTLGTQTDFGTSIYDGPGHRTSGFDTGVTAEQAILVASSANGFSDSASGIGFADSTSRTGFADSGSRIGFAESSSQIGLPAYGSSSGFSDSASHLSSSETGSLFGGINDSSSQLGFSSSKTSGGSKTSSLFSGVGGRDGDDDEKNELRVFNDTISGRRGEMAKLAQGLQQASMGMNGGSGGVDWKEGDEDDSGEEDSWEELGKPAEPSTFNVIEWDIPNDKSPKQPTCNRVIIMKDKDMIMMMKATCCNQKTGNDQRLLSLMVEIAENCGKRLRKMKTLPKLHAQHMDTLPLSDGRATKDHLAQMSKTLNDSINIREVAYRFQPPNDVYMGTFIQGTVLAKKNYAIGKAGVVAVLYKKSKYATVEAFSDQLCEHIAIAQPTTLGHLSDTDLKRLNRRGTTRIQHLQKDQLLIQNFLFDPTIIVAEAARRSFVRVDDFLLFK